MRARVSDRARAVARLVHARLLAHPYCRSPIGDLEAEDADGLVDLVYTAQNHRVKRLRGRSPCVSQARARRKDGAAGIPDSTAAPTNRVSWLFGRPFKMAWLAHFAEA